MADVHERFAKALSAVGAIGKNQKNAHHGYSYRGIDDLLNTLHGVLSDHGLFYVPKMVGEAYEEWATSRGNRLQVARLAYEFVFYAGDGSSLTVGPVVGQSADTDDKAPMQALSQAAKYALLQAFCIPTEDMRDGDAQNKVDAAGGRVADPEPEDELTKLRRTIRSKAKKHDLVAAMGAYLADRYETNSLDDLEQAQLLEIAADLNAETGRKTIEGYAPEDADA